MAAKGSMKDSRGRRPQRRRSQLMVRWRKTAGIYGRPVAAGTTDRKQQLEQVETSGNANRE